MDFLRSWSPFFKKNMDPRQIWRKQWHIKASTSHVASVKRRDKYLVRSRRRRCEPYLRFSPASFQRWIIVWRQCLMADKESERDRLLDFFYRRWILLFSDLIRISWASSDVRRGNKSPFSLSAFLSPPLSSQRKSFLCGNQLRWSESTDRVISEN